MAIKYFPYIPAEKRELTLIVIALYQINSLLCYKISVKPSQLLNRSLNAASFIMTFHHQCAATVCSHKRPYSVGSMVLGKN